MATPAASSMLLMLLVAFAVGANAATFTITNKCSFKVWPAATPVGGGEQLNPGQTWTINVPAGTSSGRVWGRTGCYFNGSRGSCQTGDCAGALSCSLSGQPATLAEFTIGGAQDYYDISVIDGFNVAMQFSCSTGDKLNCGDRNCPDACPQERNTHACKCKGNSNYQVTFCF